LGRIATALGAVACVCLVFLMLLTFGDVIGRYFFNAPITFTVEITELLMGMVILLGVGLTTLKEGHITVDILTRTLPAPLRRYQEMLARFCVVVGLAVITWQLFEQTLMVFGDGLYTQIMGIPVYPFAAVMTLAAAFASLIALWVLIGKTQGSNDGSS
jgi:TRAP-type C4-dicarboxylate transport system permease small subunit